MRTLCFLGILVLSLITAQFASAASISTGMADWQLVGVPDNAPGSFTLDASAPVITAHPAWNSSLVGGGVKWIGPTADADTVGREGNYIYQLSLALPAGTYALNATFTADNMVSSFKLNGTELLAAPQTDPWSFQQTFSVAGQGTTPLILSVVVANATYSGPIDGNPTGLIVSGEVAAVPLPAAAWTGLSMLGGLGFVRVLRRRAA